MKNIKDIVLIVFAIIIFVLTIKICSKSPVEGDNNNINTKDTTIYNITELDSIKYNIEYRDSVIYKLKEVEYERIKEANNLDDSTAVELFKELVSKQ